MGKRLMIGMGVIIAGGAGLYLAFIFSRLIPAETVIGESHTYRLLFKPAAWIIPLSALMGILIRSLFKAPEEDSAFKESKILRHDGHMFFFHWLNALAVLILVVSGLDLGPGWMPRLVHTPEATGNALNQHFIGINLFVFGLAYIIADMAIKGSVKEHTPSIADIKDTLSYYSSKVTGAKPPAQGKFLASEKLTFPVWIILFLGILVTGSIKVSVHLWEIPASIMPGVTWAHDIFALCLLALVTFHVIMGALVPWSWPLLKSMVTGYMDRDYVKQHHSLWYEEIIKNG